MIKKQLLFVNESLACAGGEKSLLTLLSLLDYNKYDVDLQLVSYGNDWDRLVDSHVNMLDPVAYFEDLKTPLCRELISIRSMNDVRRIASRLRFASRSRFFNNLRIQEIACEYWRIHCDNIQPATKEYDVAIGYAQGLPTFYVADKVKAKKKLCWINAFYEVYDQYSDFVYSKFKNIDRIVAVTSSAKQFLIDHFPAIKDKTHIFPDLLNQKLIVSLSEENVDSIRENDTTTIVTLGRLEWETKGLDLLLDAARILRDSGLRYKWYILGKGDARDRMLDYIRENKLENYIRMIGVLPNPYPILKQADIYVQTSRNEGFGIAIAEAKILNIPIVSTNFDTASVQLENEKNSLLTEFSGKGIADSILRLISDKGLYAQLRNNLAAEPKGNLEALFKFDNLIS